MKIEYILGFAGSGKSTHLAEAVGNVTGEYLVLTPTHKAKDVLLAKGLDNVFTIHSVLKLIPTLDLNFRGKMRHKLSKAGDVDLSSVSYVFLDEYSMIPQHIFTQLVEILSLYNCTLTVYGDPYQLPPVEGKPVVPSGKITHLTTQHRSEAQGVVDAFMRFKCHVAAEPVNTLVVEANGDDIISAGVNWLKYFNPDTDRILAYTNARVLELNTIVANYLLDSTQFLLGEELLMGPLDVIFRGVTSSPVDLFPKCINKAKLASDYETKTRRAYKNIAKYKTKIPYPTCEVRHTDDGTDKIFTVYYDPDYYNTHRQLSKEVERYQNLVITTHGLDKDIPIAGWCKDHRDYKYVNERGKAWQAYIAHSELVFSLTRKYATTVHKAQGSEFSSVFIDQDNMKQSVRGKNLKQYARLMYVAMSRAINRVYIIR